MKRSRSGQHLSRAKRLQKPEEDRPESSLDILILGPVPPPFGGVSMHLTRLVPRLERAGFRVGVLNHFRSTDRSFVVGALNRNPLKYYFLPKKFRKRILHYHHSRWPQLVATALGKGSSKARYIVTLHSGDIDKQFLQLTTRKPLVARITRWALRRFDTVIAVNPSIASVIEDHLQDRKVEVLPAFLESGDEEAESYESSIEAFLESGRVLVVSAYRITFLQGQSELYGLDTACEAFIELASELEDLRLAIFVARRPSRPKSRRHLTRLEKRLEDAGLRDRVLIAFGLPLVPALRRNTVYLRPTRAEGDAVSVREAQRAGVPVVASDVVARPDGVVLFPAGSTEGLRRAIESVLDRLSGSVRESSDRRSVAGEQDPFETALIRLYEIELAADDVLGEPTRHT